MLRAGHGLLVVTISLLTLGVLMVSSAGAHVGETTLSFQSILLGRPAQIALAAVMLFLIAERIPVERIFRAPAILSPAPWIVLGSFVLLALVYVPGVGVEVNGARRWVAFGPVGFQPSELVKWGVPFVLAWHAARRVGALGRLTSGFVAPLLFAGGVCTMIALEDLGTAVLVGAVAVAVLVAGGTRLWHAALILPVAAAGFVAAVIVSPYRIDRLRAFLDPYDDPRGIGYHVLQSMGAIGGGGVPGRGLGAGIQKFGYLPEDTTDFIFAITAEELGLAGALLVLALYGALMLAGHAIVKGTRDQFARLFALGIVLTAAGQALINLLVVTGLAPTKGIALPLLSNGGTGWCLTAFSLGLLAGVDRRSVALRETNAQGEADATRARRERDAPGTLVPAGT